MVISLWPFAYRSEGVDGLVNVTFVSADPGLAQIQNKTSVWVFEQQRSGSGARYAASADDTSEMFWSKGKEALFRSKPSGPESKCQEEVIG